MLKNVKIVIFLIKHYQHYKYFLFLCVVNKKLNNYKVKVMYFSINEFFPNCSLNEINEVLSDSEKTENLCHLIAVLDIIRSIFDNPIVINSGYRDEEHNRRVGGVANSWHTKMCAVDIRPLDPTMMQRLVDILDAYHEYFPEMVIHKGYIHLSIED